MLSPFEAIKRKYKAKARGKIFFFSFISATISGVLAWFFSQKENRDMVVTEAKKAGEVTKEKVLSLSEKANVKLHESMKKADQLISETKEKISQVRSHKIEPVIEDVKEGLEDTANVVKKDLQK